MAQSVMKHAFANVPKANIQRSSFDLSHGHKTTFDSDYIIPILGPVDIAPADTFNVNCQALIRLNSPTLHPLMDNITADIHYFFTPYRILWSNFEKFHGAQDDPGDSISYTIPVISGGGAIIAGDLGDYMGLPYALDPAVTTGVSALPARAYRLIWNEWYRDQNLQDSILVGTGDGPDGAGTHEMDEVPKKRGKRYDYFTSSLPSPQKGTAASIPLGTSAPVEPAADPVTLEVEHAGANPAGLYLEASGNVRYNSSGSGYTPAFLEWHQAADYLEADLTSATSATINELRLAFQTQRLLERDARSGTRYREHLLAHYGVDNADGRLQRPEFLGGGTINIQINSVPNTSEDTAQKQGELTGYGVGSGSAGFTKSFSEHGVLLGLISVRSDITYSQGLDRYWTKSTRYDFLYPVLAGVGEQATLDQEIYHDAAGTNNTDVWGYNPRYEEYRFLHSKITGLMRPGISGTLASWHLSEEFASRPSLDATFIENNTTTPLDRAIAIPSEPQWNADFFFRIKAARALPTYGVPGNLDHF